MFLVTPLVACLISYLVGSIPSGYWFTKVFFQKDITKLGSGNIGATNVARILGTQYFFLIFLFDACKAFGTLYVCSLFVVPGWLLACGAFLLIGNGYSVFLKFRGGKGVSTMLGVLAYLFPLVCLIFIGIWLLLLCFFRNVATASIDSSVALVATYLGSVGSRFNWLSVCFLIFVTGWIIFRHRSNLRKRGGTTP